MAALGIDSAATDEAIHVSFELPNSDDDDPCDDLFTPAFFANAEANRVRRETQRPPPRPR